MQRSRLLSNRYFTRYVARSLAVGITLMPIHIALSNDDLNPKLPTQFDKEAFIKELNSDEKKPADQTADKDPNAPRITVDSYGSRRFVDVVEIQPVTGPRYFLLDDDGQGTPNLGGARGEGDLSVRRSISKWRLGKW